MYLECTIIYDTEGNFFYSRLPDLLKTLHRVFSTGIHIRCSFLIFNEIEMSNFLLTMYNS